MQSNFSKNITLAVIAIALLGSSFFAGKYTGSLDQTLYIPSILNTEGEAVTKADFDPFWKAWEILNEKFVTTKEKPSDQEKVWGAIQGLASSLNDPYTVFFPPEESKMFESDIAGNFEGVGLEIAIKDNILTVVAPLKGSPAEKAGIITGDKIIKINDTSTIDMPVDKAVKLIRGKQGTSVTLSIVREGKREALEKKLIRDVIDIPTIDTEIKPTKVATSAGGTPTAEEKKNDVFVLRLYSFSANSAELFRQSLRQFVESGSHKLLIDLRGNPGGYLQAAVEMASFFLPAGKIIVNEDFGTNEEAKVYRSRGYNVFNDNLKLVILVNGGSASASEILAGALQEHGKAVLVGTKTFGKGSVQELVKITPETSLKVTVARWLTPKGNSISEGGLKPDHEVAITAEDIEKRRDPQMDKAMELLK
ncbi:MAG TPA: S41 family peptidase [Candidatus Paceibacterota bacterium]